MQATASPPTPSAVSMGAMEIFSKSRIIRTPVTYIAMVIIFVNITVDGNPLFCLCDHK